MAIRGLPAAYFDDEDEDAPFRALAQDLAPPQQLAPPPVAAPALPAAEPPPLAPPPAAAQVPQQAVPAPQRAPIDPYKPPPQNDGIFGGDDGAAWAALLDVVVNKGRGTPQIIAQASQLPDKRRRAQLDEDYRAAQINSLNRGNQPDDPAVAANRTESLRLQSERLKQQSERELRLKDELKRKLVETEAKYGAGSPQVQQVVEYYKGLGVDTANMGAMSMDTVRTVAPTVRKQADIALSPELAQAAADKTAATTGAKIDVEHAYAPQLAADAAAQAGAVYSATLPMQREKAREAAAGTQEGQGDFKERRESRIAARDFAKDHADDLDIAGLITDIEDGGGAAPEDFAERFRSTITARGIDPSRLEVWQAKQLVLEKWSRSQSGAAISNTEEGKFLSQTGMNPTASAEQVEAAYNVLGRLIQRRIRAGTTNNPAAIKVLESSGVVNDVHAYLGITPDQVSAMGKRPVQQVGQPPAAPQVAPPPAAPMPVTDTKQTAAAQEAAEYGALQNDQLPVAPLPPRPAAQPAPEEPKRKPKASDERLKRLGI